MDYRIWCVCDGTLGRREAVLKCENEIVEFETLEEAQAEAARLTKQMNHKNSTGRFTYTAVESYTTFY